MKYSKDKYDWLDDMLSKALHATNIGPDFEQWKAEHPQVVEALNSIDAEANRQLEDQETQP